MFRSEPELIISIEEFKKLNAEQPKSFVLVDVREPEEFAESKIEGCILIPLGELMSRAENELRKEDAHIIYCAHGVRSLQAVMGLRSLGFMNCKSLRGGICALEE